MDTLNEYRILINGVPTRPASLTAWAEWIADDDNKRVALTEIGDITISTVFLGVDHAFGHGNPLWFETMIFGGAHDEFQERYTTLEEAVLGHERAVELVRSEQI